MAYADIRHTGSNLVHSIRERIATGYRRSVQMRQYRETVRQLSALSARELDDLGVGRGEIHSVARASAGL